MVKIWNDNIKLLKQLSIFHTLECPIMLGISRKRFISAINKDSEPKDRLGGTISTTIHAMMQGIKFIEYMMLKKQDKRLMFLKN